MQYAPTMGFFKSAPTTAGIIYLLIGYVPDYFRLLAGIDTTNPNEYQWWNKRLFPGNSADALNPPGAASYDRVIINTGSTGVLTVNTSQSAGSLGLIGPYDGGETITTSEVATSTVAGHMDRAGNLVTVPSGGQIITQPGLALVASIQTAAKLNQWIAWRADK